MWRKNMLLPAPPLRLRKPRANPFRVPRLRPSGPTAPVLVSADYSLDDGAVVVLTFDRAVSVGPMDANAIRLAHHPSEQAFVAADGVQLDAMTVRIDMTYDDVCDPGDDVVLNAGAGNGIVAVDGGVAWAGATDLDLPFP
jgi:hypothetical protein